MSRRKRDHKRKLILDSKYKSLLVTKFINKIMMHGKKSLAEYIVYSALDLVSEKVGEKPLASFEKIIKNISPIMEVKSRRVGGSTYQVPVEVRQDRSVCLAMRWLIDNSRKRTGKSMVEKLSSEFIDAYNKVGTSMKKREETHKMAESNKAFAHFRW
ncbi:30S ribosomal protein S7 [Candidatus Margulisiibacteriota bacterium]